MKGLAVGEGWSRKTDGTYRTHRTYIKLACSATLNAERQTPNVALTGRLDPWFCCRLRRSSRADGRLARGCLRWRQSRLMLVLPELFARLLSGSDRSCLVSPGRLWLYRRQSLFPLQLSAEGVPRCPLLHRFA